MTFPCSWSDVCSSSLRMFVPLSSDRLHFSFLSPVASPLSLDLVVQRKYLALWFFPDSLFAYTFHLVHCRPFFYSEALCALVFEPGSESQLLFPFLFCGRGKSLLFFSQLLPRLSPVCCSIDELFCTWFHRGVSLNVEPFASPYPFSYSASFFSFQPFFLRASPFSSLFCAYLFLSWAGDQCPFGQSRRLPRFSFSSYLPLSSPPFLLTLSSYFKVGRFSFLAIPLSPELFLFPFPPVFV